MMTDRVDGRNRTNGECRAHQKATKSLVAPGGRNAQLTKQRSSSSAPGRISDMSSYRACKGPVDNRSTTDNVTRQPPIRKMKKKVIIDMEAVSEEMNKHVVAEEMRSGFLWFRKTKNTSLGRENHYNPGGSKEASGGEDLLESLKPRRGVSFKIVQNEKEGMTGGEIRTDRVRETYRLNGKSKSAEHLMGNAGVDVDDDLFNSLKERRVSSLKFFQSARENFRIFRRNITWSILRKGEGENTMQAPRKSGDIRRASREGSIFMGRNASSRWSNFCYSDGEEDEEYDRYDYTDATTLSSPCP